MEHHQSRHSNQLFFHHGVHNNMKHTHSTQSGFALLFTVLIVSLILTIALGISSITFKQTILSSLAKDSQIAFYQADSGVECGKYYDVTLGLFPIGSADNRYTLSEYFDTGTILEQGWVPSSIMCGNTELFLSDDGGEAYENYFVYKPSTAVTNTPCFSIIFDKTQSSEYSIKSRGYNICSNKSPRQVERGLEYRY